MKSGLHIFSLLFFLSLQVCDGQTHKRNHVDSLLTIANKPRPDSNSVNALTSLQRFYFERGLYDSSLKYALRTLPIARQLDNKKSLARVRYNLGMTYTNLTHYDSARYYLDSALELIPFTKDSILMISCYNAQAYLSNYQSDYSTAVDYLMKAMTVIDESTSPKLKQLLPQTYSNIGHNLIAEKQIQKGIDYEKKALRLRGYPNEQRYRVLLHLDIFDGYIQLQKYNEARLYLDSAIMYNNQLDNIVLTALVANNEGFYYQSTNDYSKALKSYLKAYQLNDSTGNDYLKAEAGDNVAQLYLKTKNYKESETYAREANEIGKQLHEYKVVASTYNALEQVAASKSDYKNALQYAVLNKLYADSATNKSTQQTTLSLESRYQNQKKEKEIASLIAANIKKELEVVKQNRMLIAGSILSIAVIVVLGLSYTNSRQKRLIIEKEKMLQQEQIKFLERQQQIVSLQSMINGQETERTRIAKDLHDGLGGLFSTVKMYFSTMQHDSPELERNQLFQKSFTIVDTASLEVRRIAHNMMPEVLMKLGLANALRDLCDNISAGKLLKVSLEVHGMNQRLNSTTEIMLFRIVQELLNNIIKHAHATEAIIQCVRDNSRLSVIVEDNGRGFNTIEANANNHAGMETVQSRVNYLNGRISIDSQKNVGTTVMMDFLINES